MSKEHDPIMPAAKGQRQGRRILLIGNDPAFQAHTAYLLALAGHSLSLARGESPAMRKLGGRQADGEPFELIIIDLDMPVDSGFALLDQIQALAMPVPVLILTNVFDPGRFNTLSGVPGPAIMLKSRISKELLPYIEQLNPCLSP